jgi:undecaprenyl-diphosphatase
MVASALGCLTWVPVTSFGLYSFIWALLSLATRSPVLAVVAVLIVAAGLATFVAWRRRSGNAPAAS